MSGEQQLERSVLERKERDELHAIAGALGLKPGTRTKKADLIDQILGATGVGDAGESENGSVSNGAVPAEAQRPRRTRTPRAAAAAEATEPIGESDNDEAGAIDTTAAEIAAVAAGEPAPVGAVDDDSDDADQGDSGDDDDAADEQPRGTGSNQPRDRDRDDRGGDRNRGQGGPNQPHQNQGGQNQGGQGQGGQNQGGQGADFGEPGNRRSRRRRGRDRDRPGGGTGGERDLQPDRNEPFQGDPIPVEGLLDLRDEGFGFIRTKGYMPGPDDVYVSMSQVRRFSLRKGDMVEGAARPAAANEKYPALLRVDTVNAMGPDEARQRPKFEDLTPLFPDVKLKMEQPGDPANMVARIVDLISPIGKGQRGLIVSPPKAGKTTVLKQIAHSIEANNPEVKLMVLLVDERPEEVTDMRRSVKGDVIASTFDRPSDEHTAIAELTIERAKRLVELGQDVVIVLDGITRLSRAYNLAAPATGRIMSGGIDTGALYPPKKFFGAARNIEEGGSLTILATALVETGSRMDEVIFEEFKGTGNMELRLDRRLAEKRIYPAIDVNASSTRHEELLFDRTQLQTVWKLRRVLNALGHDGTDAKALELLMDKIKHTKSNDEFLADIAKGPNP